MGKAKVATLDETAILDACKVAGKGFASIAKSTDAVIEVIKRLHAAKIKIGRRNGDSPCPYAIAFFDSCIAGGLTAKTASNCLTAFKHAVESGKAPTDWSQRGAKGAKKGAKKGATKSSTLLSKVKALYGHAEFPAFAERFDVSWKEDKVNSLVHFVENYLRGEGCTLK